MTRSAAVDTAAPPPLATWRVSWVPVGGLGGGDAPSGGGGQGGAPAAGDLEGVLGAGGVDEQHGGGLGAGELPAGGVLVGDGGGLHGVAVDAVEAGDELAADLLGG